MQGNQFWRQLAHEKIAKYNKTSHLESGLVGTVAGGLECDVCHLAGLGHDQHLHGSGHLSARQHSSVHDGPALRTVVETRGSADVVGSEGEGKLREIY